MCTPADGSMEAFGPSRNDSDQSCGSTQRCNPGDRGGCLSASVIDSSGRSPKVGGLDDGLCNSGLLDYLYMEISQSLMNEE